MRIRNEPWVSFNDGPIGTACRRRLPEQRQDCRMAWWSKPAGTARHRSAFREAWERRLGRVLDQLRNSFTGASPGGILSGGLAELVDRFRQNGHQETAESWVRTGPNQPVTPSQLQQAIGPEVLDTLSRQTGLSQEELLARLSRELPDAVDRYTPQGRLPTEAEFSR
jgi:uncharacterized protein YidB (DUF937 family)